MIESNIKYSNAKIGVFDSGVGGLSILKVLKSQMPYDDFIYFGDTKNIPYGSKTKEEIINFGRNTLNFFKERNVKNIVVACNTSSALAYETLKSEYQELNIFPLIQTVAPKLSQYNKIAVWATVGTIKSGKYKEEIQKYNNDAEVFEISCPEFVGIVENSLYDDEKSIDLVNKTYIDTLKLNPNKIILGCTHYPYILKMIKNVENPEIFIDPASVFVEEIKKSFSSKQKAENLGNVEFLVSSEPNKFIKNAKPFYEINSKVNLV